MVARTDEVFQCHVCSSTEAKQECVSEVFMIAGKRVLVENIPASVCARCGEATFRRDNSMYRRLNRVDATTAGQELRRLVEAGLVEQQGIGRWTSYRRQVPLELPVQPVSPSEEDKILAYVRQSGSITNTECRALLNVDEARAYYLLKKLCDVMHLQPVGKGKGRRYVLP